MKEVTLKSEKGFYIGDPCHVCSHEEWDKYIKDGGIEKKFPARDTTSSGDAEFFTGDGDRIIVDSGTIACIPQEECNEQKLDNCILRGLGCFANGKTAKFTAEDGIFTITIDNGYTLEINTTGDDK